MIDPADAGEVERARLAVGDLFAGVVALEGSISGEHGIGFSKAPYLGLELSADVIDLMKRVKQAFDPHGILNPGKIFPPEPHNHEGTKARRPSSGRRRTSYFVLVPSCLRDCDCQSLVTSNTRSRSRAWSGSSSVRSFTADALK